MAAWDHLMEKEGAYHIATSFVYAGSSNVKIYVMGQGIVLEGCLAGRSPDVFYLFGLE